MTIDAKDRKILSATQGGLPLVSKPFAEVASWLKMDEVDVMNRITAMQKAGIVRRIAIAPNHYALGMVANGMSVWDVDDEDVNRLGPLVGKLDFVTHCYVRPRALPDWPYNLFAMIHGFDRASVETHRNEISDLLGTACRGNDILYSTRILKKTGMRISRES